MNLGRALVAPLDRPAAAMKAVAEHPRWWLLAAGLLVVGVVAYGWLASPYQAELANQQSGQIIARVTENMPAEQAAAVRERARDMTPSRMLVTSVGVGLAMAALGWAVRGAALHFGSMALGGVSVWSSTFAVGVWAMLPYFVRDIVLSVYILVHKGLVQHAGLSALVATGDPLRDGRDWQYAALAQLDPFVLWHLLLLSAGAVVATRLGKAKALALAIVVFLLLLGAKLVPAVLGSSLMGQLGG